MNSLGRDEHADIALFRDMRIEKQHAYIRREGNFFLLVNTEGAGRLHQGEWRPCRVLSGTA